MIIFSSVTKQFGDHPPALDDISFKIGEGDLAVITGPSGSGKTSLMRLLTKEYLPTKGYVEFNSTRLDQIKSSQIHHHRRKLGIVFQDYKLLPELNVWENIALALSIIGSPSREIETRVTDLLKLVDLVDKAFLFPNQLSGGEAQRVSIARALSTAPKVIFADEPTGNLDPVTSKGIVQLFTKINDLGTTVMVTTHDPIVLEIVGEAHHLHLEKGKLTKDSGSSKRHKIAVKKAAEANKDSEDSSDKEKHKKQPKKDEDKPSKVEVEIEKLDDDDSPPSKKSERSKDSQE